MPPTASPVAAPLAKGMYAPSTYSDLRSPCPVVNSLANHGFIPRDGRNVRASELNAAMNEVGLSFALGALLARPIFLEHFDPHQAATQPSRSFFSRLLYLIRNPSAILFSSIGMRKPGQTDSMGKPCLNLDQLGLHGAVEHDISLTRHDLAEGDNLSPQADLVRDLLASSSDGGTSLSATDLAEYRKRRIATQRAGPHAVTYGAAQHQLACGEIALILDVFGDGQKIRCDYVRALFQDERLPLQEGWSKRKWWSLGLLELQRTVGTVKKLVGAISK